MHCSRRDSRGRYCWIVLVETWQMPDNDPQGVRKAIRLGREKSVTFICPDAAESSVRVRLLFDSRGNCYAPRTTNKSKQQWLGETQILDTAMGKRAEPIDLYFDTRYLRTYVRRERERKEKENPRVSSRRAYVRSTLASRSSLSLSLSPQRLSIPNGRVKGSIPPRRDGPTARTQPPSCTTLARLDLSAAV